MKNEKKMSEERTEQSTSNGPASELLKNAGNNCESIFETERIDGTPFTMAKVNEQVSLTIGGQVVNEATWKNFEDCKNWTYKNLAVIQTAVSVTMEIIKNQKQ